LGRVIIRRVSVFTASHPHTEPRIRRVWWKAWQPVEDARRTRSRLSDAWSRSRREPRKKSMSASLSGAVRTRGGSRPSSTVVGHGHGRLHPDPRGLRMQNFRHRRSRGEHGFHERIHHVEGGCVDQQAARERFQTFLTLHPWSVFVCGRREASRGGLVLRPGLLSGRRPGHLAARAGTLVSRPVFGW